MDVVRSIASVGRTVVCTIHQPSTQIFSLFDELLLLQRGGALVYNGAAAGVVEYLSQFQGAPTFEAGRNPAGWMLEVVAVLGAPSPAGGDGKALTGGSGRAAISLAEAYASSAQAKAAAQRAADAGNAACFAAKGIDGAAAKLDAPTVSSGRQPGVLTQFALLMRRNLLAYCRDPGHNISRFIITLCMAVLIGTVEFGKG